MVDRPFLQKIKKYLCSNWIRTQDPGLQALLSYDLDKAVNVIGIIN